MDTTQLLLTSVLLITGILVVVIGIHLIFLLRDIRKTLKKANKVMDEFHTKPEEFAKFINEVKVSSSPFEVNREIKNYKVDETVDFPGSSMGDVIEKMKDISEDKKQIKRFFIRSGK